MGHVSVNVFGFFILLLFESKFGMTAVDISKACFGTHAPQLFCTRHDLRCSSGRVRIQETFYMDSTVCVAPVTNCRNINVANIPLTGPKYNFSDTELNSVHKNCSGKPMCSFEAGQSLNGAKLFSVISYQCINETTQTVATVTSTNSMLTAGPGSNEASSPKQTSETNNGLGAMFAAGFFTGLGVAAIISGVIFFLYIRRRCVIKKPEPGPESLPPPAYTGLADIGPPDTYDVINRPEGETTSSEPCQAPVYQNVDDVS